eukprot:1107908-Rhodomonas_salina.2
MLGPSRAASFLSGSDWDHQGRFREFASERTYARTRTRKLRGRLVKREMNSDSATHTVPGPDPGLKAESRLGSGCVTLESVQ